MSDEQPICRQQLAELACEMAQHGLPGRLRLLSGGDILVLSAGTYERPEGAADEDEPPLGHWDPESFIVHIAGNEDPGSAWAIFLHELLHAVDDILAGAVAGDGGPPRQRLDHAWVGAAAYMLLELLGTNGLLVGCDSRAAESFLCSLLSRAGEGESGGAGEGEAASLRLARAGESGRGGEEDVPEGYHVEQFVTTDEAGNITGAKDVMVCDHCRCHPGYPHAYSCPVVVEAEAAQAKAIGSAYGEEQSEED